MNPVMCAPLGAPCSVVLTSPRWIRLPVSAREDEAERKLSQGCARSRRNRASAVSQEGSDADRLEP
jgi:hypothetical protein